MIRKILCSLLFLVGIATPALAAPSVPAGIYVWNVTPDSFAVKWDKNPTAENVNYFHVDIATGPQFYAGQMLEGWSNKWIAGAYPSFSISGLSPSTNYYMRIWATDTAGGTSAKTATVTITTKPPGVSYIKNVQYNVMGQMTQVTYGNGVVTTNTYDPLMFRLTRILTVKGTTKLQDLGYVYDSKGNILTIIDAISGANQSFTYDELGRLTGSSGGKYGAKTYKYDQIGNIVEKDGKQYFYGEGGAGPHAVTRLSDGTTFTYDADGNMASQQKGADLQTFTYDAEQQLTQVKKNGAVTATYEYDDAKKRTTKKIGSTLTVYVGGMYEKTGTTEINVVILNGQKVASIVNDEPLFMHTDHLASANVVTNATGTVREITEYDPWGSIIRQDRYGSSLEVANFYFTGHPQDKETSLVYMGVRYYNPSLGRFLTADLIVQDPADPQSLNRYTYAGNNPVNNVDPDGHGFWKTIKAWFKATVSIAVSVVAVFSGMPWIIPLFNAAWAAAQGASGGQIAAAFGIGVIAGWAGSAGAGRVGAFFNMNKAGMGLAAMRGGLTGAISGAGQAAALGGNVGKSALRGAGYGAAGGLLFWRINADRTDAFLERVKFEKAISQKEQGNYVKGIREFGQSPVGGRIMDKYLDSNEDWIIGRPTQPGAGHTEGNRTGIYPAESMWKSGPPSDHADVAGWDVRLLHEIGHTDAIFGLTPMGQCEPVPLNVSYTENLYRPWIGLPRAETRGGTPVPVNSWPFSN